MRLRILSFLVWLTVGIAVMLGGLQAITAQNPLGKSHTLPLKIVVEPQQQRIHEYQSINLLVKVVNNSKAVQSFQVMSCSWREEWKASDPRISLPGYICAANAPTTITLAPGEAYEKTLEMRQFPVVGQKIGLGRFSFRIGFTPREPGTKVQGRMIDCAYWSEPVVIQIIN